MTELYAAPVGTPPPTDLSFPFEWNAVLPKSRLLDIGPDGIGRCRLCDYTYTARLSWTALAIEDSIREARHRRFDELVRDVIADADLTLTAHREPVAIPYDELRAILGLPDVGAEVTATRTMLATRRARAFAESLCGQPYQWNAERTGGTDA